MAYGDGGRADAGPAVALYEGSWSQLDQEEREREHEAITYTKFFG